MSKPGPKRNPIYVELDEYFENYLISTREEESFQVTPNMLKQLVKVYLKREGLSLTPDQLEYWYRSFKSCFGWSLLRVTTHRRESYIDGEKERQINRFGRFVQRLKAKHGYTTARIINFDEVPCWFDMPAKSTLNRKNRKSCPINTCNADKKRYTVGISIVADGTKLPLQLIFRRKTVPDVLNTRPEDTAHVWVAEGGNSTKETIVDLVESIILPHLLLSGGGPDDEPALFISFYP